MNKAELEELADSLRKKFHGTSSEEREFLEIMRVNQNNKDLFLILAKNFPASFGYASDALKDDKDFATRLLEESHNIVQSVSDRLRNDKDFMEKAIIKFGFNYFRGSESIKANKKLLLQAIETYPEAITVAPEELKEDLEVMLAAVKENGYILQKMPWAKSNKEVVMAAVKKTGFALQYASSGLKNNWDIVCAAASDNPSSIQCASKKIKDLVGNNDPVQFYEKWLLHKKIKSELQENVDLPLKRKVKL